MSGTSYDVATALWQGARAYQEDTLLADFHGGLERGFAILADGMGGHAAGDLASRLVVIDAASRLKFLMHDAEALERTMAAELTSVIKAANAVLKDRSADDRRLHGMGTTFLAVVIFEDRLYWASVGDSPLYLWREGGLRQLNEDHSMAPVIDQMARAGEITEAEAAAHPDRNALTSVLMGQALKAMDVPETAIVLDPGDVLIQASDGVQYLEDARISQIVGAGGSSREIADALMDALRELDDPAQDNASFMVLQLAPVRGGKGLAPEGRERAVGAPGTPMDVAMDVARPPVASRRWVGPVAALGGAAVMAAVMLSLPQGQGGPDVVGPEETASLAADDGPLAPLGDAPGAPGHATAVHEFVVETAALPDAGASGVTARVIGDKLPQSAPGTPARAVSDATIEFDASPPAPEAPGAPGASAIGLDQLRPASQDARDGAAMPVPQSQRTRILQAHRPLIKNDISAVPSTSGRASQ